MENVVILASDHNGVELKSQISLFLKSKGIITIDIGPYDTEKKVDYVDYATQLGKIISNGDASKGVLICGTGVGMSIAANRNDKIRAALVHNYFTAPKCREHNDANVLCLGSWITPYPQAEEIMNIWIETSFGEGRHIKRIDKLSKRDEAEIVFTNGVFDIIHTGHIELLNFSKNLGKKLIVGINSDKAVKSLKGDDRPINNENDRKRVLESLGMVDQVIIFDNVDPYELRESLAPDILVKGGEWSKEEVRERDNVSDQIEIKICPFVKDHSTTNTIKKISDISTCQKKS